MPDELRAFLEGVTLWNVILVGTGAFLVWGVIRKLWPLFKQLADFLDDVGGEPARPGVPARAGLMERVQRIEHELFPNSGKSLRDQTNRMEQKLDRDNERIDELSTQVDGIGVQVDGLTERVEEHITQSTKIIESLEGPES